MIGASVPSNACRLSIEQEPATFDTQNREYDFPLFVTYPSIYHTGAAFCFSSKRELQAAPPFDVAALQSFLALLSPQSTAILNAAKCFTEPCRASVAPQVHRLMTTTKTCGEIVILKTRFASLLERRCVRLESPPAAICHYRMISERLDFDSHTGGPAKVESSSLPIVRLKKEGSAAIRQPAILHTAIASLHF